MKTLKEYFPTSINGNGIFTEISKIEWFDGLNASSFDTYFALKVGDRIASNSLKFFVNENGIITGEKLTLLAKTIYNINKISWKNIYRDLTVEYNPIENTNYIETVTDTGTSTGTGSTQSSGTGANTGTITNGKYAFNSSESVPDTTTTSGSNDTSTSSASTTTQGASTNEREIRKHGNIGVTQNSEMILSDLSIWENKIADKFICDICDIIALSIY